MKSSSLLTLLFVLILHFNGIGQTRPNIVWINCDDLGREVACYGNKDVHTPNMDQLAKEGVRFLNAYSNAPVCSASRSSQITGMYPSSISCLNHRTMEKKPLPEEATTVMELFREAGYFCTNGWAHNMTKKGKEDYNFVKKNLFDGTDWKQRKEGQPFFAQVQIHEPHRTFVHDTKRPIDYTTVKVPKCYPDHPIIKADWAMYLEMVQIADQRVGEILNRLKEEGLAENTVVFLFGDHGRPHLRDKQWLYEGGVQIPLIVRYPEHIKAGSERKDLISLVDVTASSLAFAGIERPKAMHGKNVLGGETCKYVYGFRGRCGDAVDDIRSITDGRYKLIWNQMPERPYMQMTSYKKNQYPAFTVYHILEAQGKLEAPYSQFMTLTRPEFELYDLKKDPNEFNNLVAKGKYAEIYSQLKSTLEKNIAIFEKNRVQESAQATQRAIAGSNAFLEKSFKKRGIPVDASYKEILEYWNKTLLEK